MTLLFFSQQERSLSLSPNTKKFLLIIKRLQHFINHLSCKNCNWSRLTRKSRNKHLPGCSLSDILHITSMMFLRRIAVAVPYSKRFLSTNRSNDLASAIAELNKEMETVFGEPPSTTNASSISNNFTAQEPQDISPSLGETKRGLTHTGSKGEAQMVDVSEKVATYRTAVASCKVILGKKVYDLVLANQVAKGDVLNVAKIAGIIGAKQTSSLIPLCHNINLTHVRVDLTLNPEDFSVVIEGEAATTGGTGVEMEAMTAVTVAGLTVYDMCKAASKCIQITNIQLERKSGGKSGDWYRDN